LENNGTNRNTRDMKTIFDRFRFSLTIKVLVVEATAVMPFWDGIMT
jgi:hypothetical protein